ncbi:MAG: molybdopterin-dependent oxidoreductase [Ardenticatenaceae bacterium]|nr:molybdopterin-dependent oxidoreductase [Ardenticatenaceae bacterium]MCB9443012.1 molybdopterin-dependent oxidoreductase [Ardenticatenaceae bacterium]
MNPIDDPLNPHSHEPNPEPPSQDATFELVVVNGRCHTITPARLTVLPVTIITNCYIVSTGHGTSGPFAFTGTRLLDLIQAYEESAWSQVEIISADGFGCRIQAEELRSPTDKPILLAYNINGQTMSRQQGLVRLIVPSEKDDALRQVKWISRICIRP